MLEDLAEFVFGLPAPVPGVLERGDLRFAEAVVGLWLVGRQGVRPLPVLIAFDALGVLNSRL